MDHAIRLADQIERRLAPHKNLERSNFMTGGYAPSALRCLGVPVPDMRSVVRAFSASLKPMPPRELIAIALALVDRRTVEGRQVGYELLARRRDSMALLTTTLVEPMNKLDTGLKSKCVGRGRFGSCMRRRGRIRS
jgi:DNA alkylation repair enzyme